MADPPPYPGTSRDDDQDAGSTMLSESRTCSPRA
jgi:hypothetical protein